VAHGSGGYLGGVVDDVRVWQGLLTSREVTRVYAD
jgi:hypothetical protein